MFVIYQIQWIFQGEKENFSLNLKEKKKYVFFSQNLYQTRNPSGGYAFPLQ